MFDRVPSNCFLFSSKENWIRVKFKKKKEKKINTIVQFPFMMKTKKTTTMSMHPWIALISPSMENRQQPRKLLEKKKKRSHQDHHWNEENLDKIIPLNMLVASSLGVCALLKSAININLDTPMERIRNPYFGHLVKLNGFFFMITSDTFVDIVNHFQCKNYSVVELHKTCVDIPYAYAH